MLLNIDLSEQYYKNHKQLMLFSGLLFAYELVGLEISSKPIVSVDIKIITPSAIPIVLLILIIYFFYRTLLGWYQSPEDARSKKVSKYDFFPSILIPIISITLYTYQRIAETQVVEYIEKNPIKETISSTFGLVIMGTVIILGFLKPILQMILIGKVTLLVLKENYSNMKMLILICGVLIILGTIFYLINIFTMQFFEGILFGFIMSAALLSFISIFTFITKKLSKQ